MYVLSMSVFLKNLKAIPLKCHHQEAQASVSLQHLWEDKFLISGCQLTNIAGLIIVILTSPLQLFT
jgi:hypothetical protein